MVHILAVTMLFLLNSGFANYDPLLRKSIGVKIFTVTVKYNGLEDLLSVAVL